jgi:multiple antibiotic resistance protein
MDVFRTMFELILPLFLIMDPVGNSASCQPILRNYTSRQQRGILLRELGFALVLMVLFQFLGDWLLKYLDLQRSTLSLAGGVILFLISLKMIFPEEHGSLGAHERDPFIVPIATPFVAGPSLLAAIMLYSNRVEDALLLLGAILIAWGVSVLIMLGFTYFQPLLGERGGRAAERLMGLILILLAVQMLEEGVRMFLASL